MATEKGNYGDADRAFVILSQIFGAFAHGAGGVRVDGQVILQARDRLRPGHQPPCRELGSLRVGGSGLGAGRWDASPRPKPSTARAWRIELDDYQSRTQSGGRTFGPLSIFSSPTRPVDVQRLDRCQRWIWGLVVLASLKVAAALPGFVLVPLTPSVKRGAVSPPAVYAAPPRRLLHVRVGAGGRRPAQSAGATAAGAVLLTAASLFANRSLSEHSRDTAPGCGWSARPEVPSRNRARRLSIAARLDVCELVSSSRPSSAGGAASRRSALESPPPLGILLFTLSIAQQLGLSRRERLTRGCSRPRALTVSGA